jgi:hypothetical protein
VLPDAEILDLLAYCEAATGTVLKQIRGNLRSRDWLAAVWELVVGEAASKSGRIRYETSAGGPQSDWLLELPGGDRLWLEAAFALKSPPGPAVAQTSDHPAFPILKRKAGQAKDSTATDPVVLCLGTDRVLQLGQEPGRNSRDWVVQRFFQRSTSLSAVIVVPILLRPEMFVGFARDAEPAFFKNPRARSPLSEGAEAQLLRLNFNHRKASVWTVRSVVPASLSEAIDQLGQDPISTASTPDSSPQRFTWSYSWRFNHLGIERFGDSYCLFNGDELLARCHSAEEAARFAASCFQPYPAHIFGPHGIEPNPDRGVSPDLREWQHCEGGSPT